MQDDVGRDFEDHEWSSKFSARFIHRLLFTDDVFGDDEDVLESILEPSSDRPARVQFWLDSHVVGAAPDLKGRIEAFLHRHRDRLELSGGMYVIPGGEAAKNDFSHIDRILEAINQADLDRRSYVVVVGGGAVLDAVGFAAAIAHRGIRLVRLPTTTLAQADSGVGVKNAVNYFGKKNWLGSFAVPWAVINDESLLSTLPDRDYIAGFSEAVKVSLLKDATAFERIERDAHRIRLRDAEASRPIIRESARMHLDHITRGGDPFEMLEARPLDFGHWSAHKLEPMTAFALRHGEAVAIGVAIDSVYSSMVHGLPQSDARRVLDSLTRLGFSLNHAALDDTDALLSGLEEFRQHLGGRLTITLLRGVGDPIDVHEIDHDAMRRAIRVVSESAVPEHQTMPVTANVAIGEDELSPSSRSGWE